LPDEIVFFVDQCMAGTAIPETITKASGCETKIFREHFDLDAKDPIWLPEVGKWGWVLVTKDWRIQRRPLERTAILNAGVRAFVLEPENLPLEAILTLLRLTVPKFMTAIQRYKAPFIFAVEMNGELKALSDLIPNE